MTKIASEKSRRSTSGPRPCRHRRGPATLPALEPYRALLVEVYSRRGEMAPAWEALCVGLITHPDFYSY